MKNINKSNFYTLTFPFVSIFSIDPSNDTSREYVNTLYILSIIIREPKETNLIRLELRTFPILEQLERGLSLLAAGGDASILYLCNRNDRRPVMQACGRVQWHEETTDVRVLVKSVRIGWNSKRVAWNLPIERVAAYRVGSHRKNRVEDRDDTRVREIRFDVDIAAFLPRGNFLVFTLIEPFFFLKKKKLSSNIYTCLFFFLSFESKNLFICQDMLKYFRKEFNNNFLMIPWNIPKNISIKKNN